VLTVEKNCRVLRNDLECSDVAGPHDAEVAAVQSRNHSGVVTLRERDHAGIGATEGEIDLVGHERGDPS
jgi:hypothetical protein